jgi:enoyl-CoA hydratase/carnithine racemase
MAPAARSLRFETLTTTQVGRVLTVRYDRPPLNFMDDVFAREFHRLVRSVDRDPSVGAVVFTGGPDDRFITHFDVGQLSAAADTPAPPLNPDTGSLVALAGLISARLPGGVLAWERFGGSLGRALVTLSRLHAVIRALHRSGVVYLSAINGPCLGAGLEFALACDLRFVADDENVVLGQPEILGGIIPGAGGTQHLPRVIGTGAALEMILEGRLVGPAEALSLGLVHRVVEPAVLLRAAQETAARLATRSRMAVAGAKRAVYASSQVPIGIGLLIEAGGLIAAGRAPESRRLSGVFKHELDRLGETPFLVDPRPWQAGAR